MQSLHTYDTNTYMMMFSSCNGTAVSVHHPEVTPPWRQCTPLLSLSLAVALSVSHTAEVKATVVSLHQHV